MRLLVAIDGTDASDDALTYALDIAARLDVSLLLTHVVEPAVHVTDESTQEVTGVENGSEAETQFVRGAIEDARATGDQLLQRAARRAETLGVDVDTAIRDGDPLEELTALADESAVDGIVVGHRGADTHAERVDSVAKGLLARSSVPVTVVP